MTADQDNLGTTPPAQPGADHYDLAIVGGGFSGLCTAWHLLTRHPHHRPHRIILLEPDPRLGAGLAYRTDSPHHLLNVRAKGMSIAEDDPGHFTRWLAAAAPSCAPGDFVPRGLYRRYLSDSLEQARAMAPPEALTVRHDAVQAMTPEPGIGYLLTTAAGETIRARQAVLALGNLPPLPTPVNSLLAPPWATDTEYRALGTLAIVGAGLTALDVILEAEAAGFAGRYLVISPHGHFPLPHGEPHYPVGADLHQWAAGLAAAAPPLRQLLREFQNLRHSGSGWEQLTDALRRHAPELWRRLTPREQDRFLRHLRTLWSLHLHRCSPDCRRTVDRLRAAGRLEQLAARVTGVERRHGTAVRLLLQHGTHPLPPREADLAVNSTGLFCDIRRTDSLLAAQLLADGLARPDRFNLGVLTDDTGRLLGADGRPQPGLFALGTLRRGTELECTAVPEIRRQVRRLTEEIIRTLAVP